MKKTGAPDSKEPDDIRRVQDKAREIDDKLPKLKRLVDDARLLLQLVRDYSKGDYREVPYWAISAAAIALLYVLNPADVIPDMLFGVGFLDDAAVVAFCLKLVRQELDRYQEWKARSPSTPGDAKEGPVIDV
ncbi:MAG: DUF1232 domain-containing protein [Verrucomicrobiales bacterium]|nr:DUF1232 domain-containing protein [Verrucomicrobiales bacterium]